MAVRAPDPARLPQPGWRLIGFASIGLGTGLFTAEVPFVVLVAALVPALITMVIIAAQAAVRPSQNAVVEEPTRSRAGGNRHG